MNFATLAAIQAAVQVARKQSLLESKASCGRGFHQSRGVEIVIAHADEPKKVVWGGTMAEIREAAAEAAAAGVALYLEGGHNFAATMADLEDGSYEPFSGEWSVEIQAAPLPQVSPAGIDTLVRTHTAFSSMSDMLSARGGYRPSLNTSERNRDAVERATLTLIADAYDAAQQARGDERRAYRY